MYLEGSMLPSRVWESILFIVWVVTSSSANAYCSCDFWTTPIRKFLYTKCYSTMAFHNAPHLLLKSFDGIFSLPCKELLHLHLAKSDLQGQANCIRHFPAFWFPAFWMALRKSASLRRLPMFAHSKWTLYSSRTHSTCEIFYILDIIPCCTVKQERVQVRVVKSVDWKGPTVESKNSITLCHSTFITCAHRTSCCLFSSCSTSVCFTGLKSQHVHSTGMEQHSDL